MAFYAVTRVDRPFGEELHAVSCTENVVTRNRGFLEVLVHTIASTGTAVKREDVETLRKHCRKFSHNRVTTPSSSIGDMFKDAHVIAKAVMDHSTCGNIYNFESNETINKTKQCVETVYTWWA